MCGLFSVISFSGDVDKSQFEAALDKIAHRGPDDSGVQFLSPKDSNATVAFGHRRLSIFDLSKAGHQPMTDDTGRWLIFNGEIFNWPELRDELQGKGYRFKSNTDSEVVLAAYDHWGESCVKHFNGFWSFVICDLKDAKKVFVSRDHLGIKPLYFHKTEKEICFSSEISSIWQYRNEQPIPDSTQLTRYLVHDLSHDSSHTIYEDILEIEPGFNAVVDLSSGTLKQSCYWELPQGCIQTDLNDSDVLEEFSYLMEDSVRLRLRADREVALTLSGGIDSSVIAVAASRVSDTKVKAFTSHFPGRPDLDESNYASIVADRLKLEHVLVSPAMGSLAENERALTRHQELMYTSFSQLINWFVVKEIAEHDTVVYLTGQGGDEVFIGYERYAVSWIFSMIRENPVKALKSISDMVKNSRLTWKEIAGFLVYFSNKKVRTRRYIKDAEKIFSPEILDMLSEEAISVPRDLDGLQKMEVAGSQLRRLLRYDDRTSSAFGIEARPAFLDHRLVEFSAKLGWEHKIRNGWTKHLLRRYLDEAGLPEIAWRTHKFGYAAPTKEWTEMLMKQTMQECDVSKHLNGIFRQDFDINNVPERLRFKVYNLISTASELDWRNG